MSKLNISMSTKRRFLVTLSVLILALVTTAAVLQFTHKVDFFTIKLRKLLPVANTQRAFNQTQQHPPRLQAPTHKAARQQQLLLSRQMSKTRILLLVR